VRSLNELPAPFVDRLASLQSRRPRDELTVVDVRLVQRVGPTVIGSPGVFGDEAAELDVIGFAYELLRRRGKYGL